MSNEQIAQHAIQLLFLHHGLKLGPGLYFEQWAQSDNHLGWQEIVFEVYPARLGIQFKGVEVYWGNSDQRFVLFGSDCDGIESHIGQSDFWTLLLPFCETVLSLSQHIEFAPLIRVDWCTQNQTNPTTFFFQLSNFNYTTLQWTNIVPSLATPIAVGA